ncbi:AraC family transcriptional regulator [Paucibacter sp. AS339]|uniref:AraC family transcriptional regulator n=1 Tax=Paucibacter hankyongi TaxID=3133434 RepID=UPI0030B1057F
MSDPLAFLLQRFELKARVFHAGNLCTLVNFDAVEGVGHLHLLKAGTLDLIRSDGSVRHLNEPSLLFFPRSANHRIRADEQAGADLICASVQFGAQLGNPLINGLPELMVIPLRELPQMAAVLDALFSEAFSPATGRDAALDRLSEVVLIYLLRHALAQGALQSGVLAGLADPRLAKALSLMHAEPATDWSLEQLAEAAGMSRARFAAHFAEIVGTPPGDYLAGWRIKLAMGLLLRGRQVKTIADEVGYGSANALTRAFGQRTGMTPTEWLQQQTGRSAEPQAAAG